MFPCITNLIYTWKQASYRLYIPWPNVPQIWVWHTQTKKNAAAQPVTQNNVTVGSNLDVIKDMLWKDAGKEMQKSAKKKSWGLLLYGKEERKDGRMKGRKGWEWMFECLCVCVCVCVCEWLFILCTYVCMYVWLYVCRYVWKEGRKRVPLLSCDIETHTHCCQYQLLLHMLP